MLQKLREKTSGWIATVILGLLVIPFAFFGMESYMSQRVETFVARIAQPPAWWPSAPQVWPLTYLWNNHDIDAQAYRQRLEIVRMNMREKQGENFDAKAFESVENKRKIVDAMLDETLMQLEAERDDIVISDAEVRKEIQQIPGFQVDGKFNADRYQLLLASQNPPMSPREFENKIRDSLKNDLIPSSVAGSALVTNAELDRLMRLLGAHRDVSFVMLPEPAEDTAVVTDAQIDAWYKGHPAAYRRAETVRLEYIEVNAESLPPVVADEASLRKRYQEQIAKYSSPERREVSHILIQVAGDASAADKKAAEEKAAKLAAQAAAPGADFAALAKANSEDTGSRDKGGDLGWLTKGSMPGAFDDAAFAMQAGAVSKPVKSDFGWHIIKINKIEPGVQRSFEEVREQLATEMQERDRERAFNDLTGKLVDAVYKNPTSLEPAAKALGLQVQTTGEFSRAGGEGIASNEKILRAAFSSTLIQDGTASDPIELGPEHTVLIRVIAHEPERAMPLTEVRDAVIAAIHADRRQKAAIAAADALVTAAKAKGLEAAANAAGLPLTKLDDVQRGSQLPSAAAVKAFFNVPRPRNNVIPVDKVEAGGQFLVFAVRAVRDGDLTKVTAQERTQLQQQLTMAYGLQAQRAFIKSARDKYQIKIAEDRL